MSLSIFSPCFCCSGRECGGELFAILVRYSPLRSDVCRLSASSYEKSLHVSLGRAVLDVNQLFFLSDDRPHINSIGY